MDIINKNWKTTIIIILSVITSLYQVLVDNAEFLGVDNRYIMIISLVITSITIIVNGIKNGTGETKINKLLSYIKI